MVVWFHDELTFYVNDRKVKQWVHVNETAKPYAKGEGLSQMVADMVSADYVKSLLEITCEARGFTVLFIPKFHCELNFIEQFWGFAKRIYCHYLASSKEADLERNVLVALESVPLESMQR